MISSLDVRQRKAIGRFDQVNNLVHHLNKRLEHLKVNLKPSIEPIPLKLNPSKVLMFNYITQWVQSLQRRSSLKWCRGKLGRLGVASFPLNVEGAGKTISVSVTPQAVPVGRHDGLLSMRSADNRAAPAEAIVSLAVHPALKPWDSPVPRTEPAPLPPPPGLEPVFPPVGTTIYSATTC